MARREGGRLAAYQHQKIEFRQSISEDTMFNRICTQAGLVVASLLCIADAAHAAKLYDYQESKLDNGLRVISLEDFSTPIVAVHVWYHVGSKNEDTDRTGFAHMFEHMMFRGTENLGPEEHFALIRATGGSCNAFTGFDYTAYVNTLPSNQIDLALWLEAERMMFLKVDQEGFDTERKVVEEERRMGLNEPYGTAAEFVAASIFKSHPYRWMPIGSIPDLRAAEIWELQHFWDKYYVPSNATLVVVGAIKHSEVKAKAEQFFGWMPSGVANAPLKPEPPQDAPRELTVEEPFGPVPLIGYAYRGVPKENPDSTPLELLMRILGGGESSRLYQDLVKEKKVCQQVEADTYFLEDDGIFGAGAALNPDGDLDAVLKEIDGHLNRLINEKVSDRELEKAKNQYRRILVTDTLTVYSKADELGRVATTYRKPGAINEQLAEIDRATVDDLQRVAKSYLTPERRTLVRIVPNKDKALPDESKTAEKKVADEATKARSGPKVGIKRPESFPNKPPIKDLLEELPEPQTKEKVLANGLKVVVMPNSEVPFVTVMLGLQAGAYAEDAANPGVANMALDMLTKGTKNYSAAKLAEEIEFNALTLNGNASQDTAEVTATGLSEKLPLAIDLLAEVVLRPTFPDDEFAIAKEQLQLSLQISEKDPNYVVDRALRRKLYGDHPYSRTVSGEAKDVERIATAQLKTFWSKFARPDMAVLYVAGDAKPANVFELVEKAFGEWKADGGAPKVDLPKFPEKSGTQIYIVDRPGAVQSEIRVAQLSIDRKHPDFNFSRVFTQIYGGAFNSRLNKVIRVERGLTYGAGGGITPSRFTGAFRSSTFTKTPTTAETVQAILDVINGMRTSPPTDQEIDEAKSYLVGNFPSQFETPQDVLRYAWLIESNSLPKDYLNRALKDYKATTSADLKRVADDDIDPGKLVIVVAGEAAKIKESLEKIAPVTVLEQAPAPAEKAKPAA
jgi:zinc protease